LRSGIIIMTKERCSLSNTQKHSTVLSPPPPSDAVCCRMGAAARRGGGGRAVARRPGASARRQGRPGTTLASRRLDSVSLWRFFFFFFFFLLTQFALSLLICLCLSVCVFADVYALICCTCRREQLRTRFGLRSADHLVKEFPCLLVRSCLIFFVFSLPSFCLLLLLLKKHECSIFICDVR
jgi:hypothetical protein